MVKKIFFVGLISLFWAVHTMFAVPAVPWEIVYKQPDSSKVTITMQGDEQAHWAVSQDGFTLLFNTDGYLEYAVQDESGDLQLSGIRAHDETERSPAERMFLADKRKSLKYSKVQLDAMYKLRETREQVVRKSADALQRAYTGTIRVPLILTEFKNKTFQKTKADFEMLMNQLNYTQGGLTGSVRDYYLANSYGQCDVQVDIFGPYKLSNNIIAYDDNSVGGNPRNMAREVAIMASEDGLDFSMYANSSGVVESFHIIYAGYGQEAGAVPGTAIWAHAWFFNQITLNGVKVSNYSCSPELRNDFGNNITYIGVIAHELGHAMFGLPDFYDTDESGVVDLDKWDIMASGSWNDNGRTPAFFSAYGRDYCGWVEAITLSSSADIWMPNPNQRGLIYRINTTKANEYFLLENRQKTAWDAYIPGSGLLIYHVDKNYSGWTTNKVNANASHRGYYVKQAGCNNVASTCPARTTDPFPRNNKTNFTDATIPSSKSWAGVATDKPITDIIHDETKRSISFKFMGGATSSSKIIKVNPNGVFSFENRLVNYEIPPTLTVSVSNRGNQPIDNQNIALSGADAESFEISKTMISGLPVGTGDSFAIMPKMGLAEGTYTATVTLTEINATTSKTLDVSFFVGNTTNLHDKIDPKPEASLQAWIENGFLHVKGLAAGETWQIYSILGVVVYQGVATEDNVQIDLQSRTSLQRGTYIVRSKHKSVKFVYEF